MDQLRITINIVFDFVYHAHLWTSFLIVAFTNCIQYSLVRSVFVFAIFLASKLWQQMIVVVSGEFKIVFKCSWVGFKLVHLYNLSPRHIHLKESKTWKHWNKMKFSFSKQGEMICVIRIRRLHMYALPCSLKKLCK